MSRSNAASAATDQRRRSADAADDASREELVACAELLFFAYRDFTGDPDAVLEEYGFGRAHHRVLHFVHRHPGLRVADLLDILKITKQSLARVLKQLIDKGFIMQRPATTIAASGVCSSPPRAAVLPISLLPCRSSASRRPLPRRGRGAREFTRPLPFCHDYRVRSAPRRGAG